jgi:hypothetical protein
MLIVDKQSLDEIDELLVRRHASLVSAVKQGLAGVRFAARSDDPIDALETSNSQRG